MRAVLAEYKAEYDDQHEHDHNADEAVYHKFIELLVFYIGIVRLFDGGLRGEPLILVFHNILFFFFFLQKFLIRISVRF